ncbi:Up-regulated during skeletal muscle growth protein 5 [Aix galericulata]|nr:Up-regulated during skeletal muscle growth protein 5 [Aix galericulata]
MVLAFRVIHYEYFEIKGLFLVLVATASLHNQAGRATMAGHDSGSQHQFTGFQKYFNSYTMVGRRNYVIATYTGLAMLILYFKLRSKKKTPAVADNQASNHGIYLLFTSRHSIKDINVEMFLNNVPDLIVLLFLQMPLQELEEHPERSQSLPKLCEGLMDPGLPTDDEAQPVGSAPLGDAQPDPSPCTLE